MKPRTRTLQIGPHAQATLIDWPDCEVCGGLDCAPYEGARYVERCAVPDRCSVCGGGCPIDYTGEHQCRRASTRPAPAPRLRIDAHRAEPDERAARRRADRRAWRIWLHLEGDR